MSKNGGPDYDKDGIVSDAELDLQIKLEKATAQTNIATIALVAMIGVMVFLLSPWAPSIEMIAALDATLATYMIACASVVGAYMGFTSWLARR